MVYAIFDYCNNNVHYWVDSHQIPRGFSVPVFDLYTHLTLLYYFIQKIGSQTVLGKSYDREAIINRICYAFDMVKIFLVMLNDIYPGEESLAICKDICKTCGEISALLKEQFYLRSLYNISNIPLQGH